MDARSLFRLGALSSLFFLAACQGGLEVASGVSLVDSVPAGCEIEQGRIRTGPSWISPCKDVCVRNYLGSVVGTSSVFFSPRTCLGNQVTVTECVPSPFAKGCNAIRKMRRDPRNTDCGSEQNLVCREIQLRAKCKHLVKETGRKVEFSSEVKRAFCVRNGKIELAESLWK